MIATTIGVVVGIATLIVTALGYVIKVQRDTITDLRADHTEDVNNLRADVHTRDERIASLETLRGEKRAEIERLSGQFIAEQRAHLQTQTEMQTSIDALTRQVTQLTDRLDKAATEIADLKAQVQLLQGSPDES